MIKSNQPIGIFDSGIGGLTVAKAVKAVLPNESLIYFGDTAHLPYGDKSQAAIQAYSVRIAEMLIQRNCKVILIACNSASSAAYELVKEYVGKKAYVFDVINPTVDFIREHFQQNALGLIGTKQTIGSEVYQQKIQALSQQVEVRGLATPLLVPMIEEGILEDRVSQDIVNRYLSDESLAEIAALILGCTHYPIIKKQILHYYEMHHQKVQILDSADIVANSLKSFLNYHQLINGSDPNSDAFLVSDFTDSFEHTTKTFFGREVQLERIPIWDELT